MRFSISTNSMGCSKLSSLNQMMNPQTNYLRTNWILIAGWMIFPFLVTGQIFNDNCNGSVLPAVDYGLPTNFNPNDLHVESLQLPYPVLTYLADSNEIYVIGGQAFSLDLFVDQKLTGTSGVPNVAYYNQFRP